MLSFSTGIRNGMLTTGSFKSLMDNCVLRIYSGPVPGHPDAADRALGGSNTLLAVITVSGDGTPLTFQGPAANGAITKNLSEVWMGGVLATGTPTFFRLVKPTDDGVATTTLLRVQGTAGAGNADLGLTSDLLIEGAPLRIGTFTMVLPDRG